MNDRMVAAAKAATENGKQLEAAEKKLADFESQLKTGVMPSVNEPVLKQIARATPDHRRASKPEPKPRRS